MIIDHGIFTIYDPGLPSDHPLKRAQFARNEEMIDFYELRLFMNPTAVLVWELTSGLLVGGDIRPRDAAFVTGLRCYEVTEHSIIDPKNIAGKYLNHATGLIEEAPLSMTRVPSSISFRQFCQALANVNYQIITVSEAKEFMRVRTIPHAVEMVLENFSEAERDAAEMFLMGVASIDREHPITAAIGATYGMAPADIDNFFRFAATL